VVTGPIVGGGRSVAQNLFAGRRAMGAPRAKRALASSKGHGAPSQYFTGDRDEAVAARAELSRRVDGARRGRDPMVLR
jgi:hypothetical protein